MAGTTKKIRLLKHVIVKGHGPQEPGTQFEVDINTANELLGSGAAELVDPEKAPTTVAAAEPSPTTATRIETARHTDPAHQKTEASQGPVSEADLRSTGGRRPLRSSGE
jgi:hypothetical protein